MSSGDSNNKLVEGHQGDKVEPIEVNNDTEEETLRSSKNEEGTTLKRRTMGSEERILLRQTDLDCHSSNNNKLSASSLTHKSLASKQRKEQTGVVPAADSVQVEKDEDTNSVTTTTSDVNSDDDAASIVSRLSQIVVEQEGKLTALRDSLTESSAGGEGDSGCFHQHNSGGSRHRKRSSTPSKLPAKKSVANDIDLSDSRSTEQLPEIYVIGDQEDDQQQRKQQGNYDESTLRIKSNKSDRSRAKSVVEPRNLLSNEIQSTQPNQSPNIRRNESSGYLPERGDLRSLEISRKNQYASLSRESGSALIRNRSNTAGSMENQAGGVLDLSSTSASGNQLMLNIRRSAWTLNEFDQTFNKSSDKSETSSISDMFTGGDIISESPTSGLTSTGGSNTVLADIAQPQQVVAAAAAKLGASIQEKQNNNLLIRASKNAISLNQHQSPVGVNNLDGGSRYINNCPTGTCIFDDDRRHSVVSFSSLDSFCNHKVLRGKNFRLASRKRRESQNNGGGYGDDGDDNEQQSCFRSCCNLETIGQFLPILQWLPNYNRSFLWNDLMAGLAVAVLNISISLTAAIVAETDSGAAFRASIVNTFVYAILCSSKHTSFGSWSIMSQMLVVSVRRALSDELLLSRLSIGPSTDWDAAEYERWHLNIIIMYTFLIGLTQLIAGLLNFGNILSSFIPEALCSSMIAATAFTMAVGQLANMCGTSNKILWSIERNTTALWADLKNPPVDITDLFAGLFRWIQQIALLIKYYEQINVICVVISVGSVIMLFLNQCVIQKQLEKQFKRKIFIPIEMILLIVMITLSYSLGLKENYNVSTCGPIDIDFEIPTLPNLKLIRELWFESLATALISYSMVYIMAKTYSNKLNYEVDCNQELIACGAGNLIGGLFDALPATASFSRTAGQVEAGGKTQMASIINCVVLVISAKLLGHHVEALPVCVMSATLFYGFVRMMTRFMEVFNYWRVCKVDFAIWLVTFVAILTLDLVNGFVYGFIFSILTMLYRAQNRRCYMLGSIGSSDVYVPLVKYPLAQEIEGIKIFQFCGPIHYVCADLFERLLRRKTRVDVKRISKHIAEQEIVKFNPRDMNLPSHIILDFSMISFIDSAGINVIRKIIEDYSKVNVTVLLASLASHVAAVIKSEPSLWEVYKERFYITLADAVHCAIRDSRLQQSGAALDNQITID